MVPNVTIDTVEAHDGDMLTLAGRDGRGALAIRFPAIAWDELSGLMPTWYDGADRTDALLGEIEQLATAVARDTLPEPRTITIPAEAIAALLSRYRALPG